MFIVKYDFCYDDETREYGIEEEFSTFEDAREYKQSCIKDEGCYNIQLIDLSE